MDNSRSMLEVAFQKIQEADKSLSFAELYGLVAKELAMTDEEKKKRLGVFYTGLTLDSRFVAMSNNTWDLRSRHTYSKVHIDVYDVYNDVETEAADEEDVEEEKEYNAAVEGKPLPDEETDAAPEEEGNPNLEEKPVDVDVDALVGK